LRIWWRHGAAKWWSTSARARAARRWRSAPYALHGRLYAFDTHAKRLTGSVASEAQWPPNVHPAAIATETDARIKRLAGKIDRVLVTHHVPAAARCGAIRN